MSGDKIYSSSAESIAVTVKSRSFCFSRTKNIYLFLLVTLMLFFHNINYAASNVNPFILPVNVSSVSYSEEAFSHLLNPVFTDVPGSSFFSYRYRKYTGEDKGDHFLFTRILGFSLTYGRYHHLLSAATGEFRDTGINFYNISRGFFFGNVFGFGAGYTIAGNSVNNNDNFSSWNFGLLFRPVSFLSAGAVVKDYNAEYSGDKLERSEIYSISLRPYTGRLTLSADAERSGSSGLSDMRYSYSINVRFPYEVTLFARRDDEKNIFIGLRFPLYLRRGNGATVTLDAAGSRLQGDSADYSSFGISYPDTIYGSALHVSGARNMLFIKLNRTYKENALNSYFDEKEIVFFDLIRGIKEAESDESIDGIILQIDQAGLGFAQIQEMREQLKRFRSKGKRVYAIMTAPGNREYFLATASDKIYFTPNSSFSLQGLKAEVYYFKGLADIIGIKLESFRRGKYKSFAEPWTREKMSPEFRENLNTVLGDLNGQFIQALTVSRKLKEKHIRDVFTAGLMTPDEAKRKNLIDEVMYPDEAVKNIGDDVVTVKLKDFLSENRRSSRWGPVPAIAVIYVDGSIIRGKSRVSQYLNNIGDESYRSVLERVFSDNSVKAVIIRVNSGGGSASASDYMWRTLVKLKKQYNKPVVISFGNSAASGGYYIACTGDRILGSSGTITGSIGVVFGKLSLKELYSKLGINKEVVKMSQFADIMSESKDLTDSERKIIQKGIDFTYRRFLDKVMSARGIKEGGINSVAEGRVFTGKQALKNKLIDEIGGLSAAVEYARDLGQINGSYRVLELPEYRIFMNGLIQSNSSLNTLRDIINRTGEKTGLHLLMNSDTLYLLPYIIEIR